MGGSLGRWGAVTESTQLLEALFYSALHIFHAKLRSNVNAHGARFHKRGEPCLPSQASRDLPRFPMS